MRDNEQMNSNQNSRAKFKQRVAGGAVLLIVLAIFLPFIFNHSHMGATTPADNNVAAPQAAAPADQAAQPAAQVSQDQSQLQAPAQAQAADPAASAPAATAAPVAQTAAPATDSAAPQSAAAPAAQQAPAATDQSMRSDQPGLTAPQNESAAAPQAQVSPPAIAAQPEAAAPVQAAQQNPSAAAPTSVAQPAQPVVKAKPAHSAALPPPSKTSLKTTAQGHWLVQVGSFTQAEYADQLVSKLRAHGLHAYAKHEPNHLVRVYIGPVASQQQALKIQQQVQQEFQLSSLVKQNRA